MRVLLLTGWENCCCPCYSRACNRSCVTVAEAAAAAHDPAELLLTTSDSHHVATPPPLRLRRRHHDPAAWSPLGKQPWTDPVRRPAAHVRRPAVQRFLWSSVPSRVPSTVCSRARSTRSSKARTAVHDACRRRHSKYTVLYSTANTRYWTAVHDACRRPSFLHLLERVVSRGVPVRAPLVCPSVPLSRALPCLSRVPASVPRLSQRDVRLAAS
jgi:hypothetical protein